MAQGRKYWKQEIRRLLQYDRQELMVICTWAVVVETKDNMERYCGGRVYELGDSEDDRTECDIIIK